MAGGNRNLRINRLKATLASIRQLATRAAVDDDLSVIFGCGAPHNAPQGGDARDCPPDAASSPDPTAVPVMAACPIGERHSGRLWDTVRWTGSWTLLVGPGVTLTLSASDIDAIHAATGRVIADRSATVPVQEVRA